MTLPEARPALVATTRDELRALLAGDSPGLVPTMGALHEGHLSLIRRAAGENERVVVSIFVNPTQFGDPADLARYPRRIEQDAELAAAAGAHVIFAPAAAEMYPPGFATSVAVDGLSDRWEGAARPGHFRGVATVVALLLNLAQPARSYFGEKDYQQLLIVRRLHADLALPGAIVGCPTVRDDDGLALSSRNVRLSAAERSRAILLPRALFRMAELAAEGVADAARLTAVGMGILAEAPSVAVDYLAVVDPETLDPIATLRLGARAIAAVEVGDVRLIDNVELLAPTG